MLLSGAVRGSTKEPYRNHICIHDELRWRRGWEHCPPALYRAASLTPPFSHLLSPTLHPSLHLIYSHHPYLLPRSQHGSPCIVFPESSKVDGSLLIRAGYCTLSACGRASLRVNDSVCVCPGACMCEHIQVEICVCGSISNGW